MSKNPTLIKFKIWMIKTAFITEVIFSTSISEVQGHSWGKFVQVEGHWETMNGNCSLQFPITLVCHPSNAISVIEKT